VAPHPSAVERFGRVLFRYRSFTPVPVIALILALLFWRHGSGAIGVEHTLDAAGIGIALCGQILRAWVLGQVPPGTSGQGETLEAAVLNTQGPYARVRNPLYVGNFLLVAGLLVIANDPWAWLVGVGFFAFQYAFIVRTEEAFLRGRFGAEFDAYCAKVPRWLPRLSGPAGTLSDRFDLRRALFKEHNPFTAWASGALALMAFKAWTRGGSDAGVAIATYAAIEAFVLLAFLAIKGWKHGWIGSFDAGRQR
jgi:protein-S-isoprenylcysteine O-methyltransferase Ste14